MPRLKQRGHGCWAQGVSEEAGLCLYEVEKLNPLWALRGARPEAETGTDDVLAWSSPLAGQVGRRTNGVS